LLYNDVISQLLPLPYRLEEEDGGADGDVEGVETAEHGDAYVGIGGLAPLVGETCGFGSHDYCGGTTHVDVVIEAGVLKLGGEDADISLFEEGDALV
jgi:hypothetical protein